MKNNEQHALSIWNRYAAAWKDLVSADKIESRKLITNDAILSVVLSQGWANALDAGCGEGWLVKKMEKFGIVSTGIDGSEALIDMANAQGAGDFHCMSYGDIIAGKFIPGSPFDGIVINYALFDKEGVSELLRHLKKHLTPIGKIVIQTVHPYMSFSKEEKEGRWEKNIWEGLPGDFQDGYEWYNRTMHEWEALFEESGLEVCDLMETQHPETGKWISVIFELEAL